MKQETLEEAEWTFDHVQCNLCNHKWMAVYLYKLNRLECPNCSNMVMFEQLKNNTDN